MARRASCFVGQNGRLMGATSLTLVAVRRMENTSRFFLLTRLKRRLGKPWVNLGVMQAGLTATADSPDILPVTSNARMTLVQILDAQNMPNPFYSVHPRRNDRFVSASVTVQRLFPSVDFTGSHVTGHLLGALADTAQSALQSVVSELKIAWVSRLKMIVKSISGDTALLWTAERRPEDPLLGQSA